MEHNWFFEKSLPGVLENLKIGFKIKRKIFSGRSPYQKIEVFDTYQFGRILVLDGIVQLSQSDELIYHEMISHLPLLYHRNPKKILIIGGGDGGVLREVLKHPIKEVFLVDIDKKVIEVSQKYLTFVSKGAFQDKRVKICIEDGLLFVKKYRNYFDVIIVDSTDPGGPSLPLFRKKFYKDIFNSLRKDGIIIVQAGSIYLQFPQIKRIFKNLKKIFSFVKIHWADIPAYQSSAYIFILGSKKIDFDKINSKKLKERYKKLNLKTKYYSPEIHRASGILPKIYQIN